MTAGALAVTAHLLFGFGWTTAMLIGAALSPTDPAVVFSVLGQREIEGRDGTILEAESGANDPVGIALMPCCSGPPAAGSARLPRVSASLRCRWSSEWRSGSQADSVLPD